MIGSITVSSWLRSKSVNRLRGWSRVVGSVPARGCSPVSCAGTAAAVESLTVVALRYQVDSPASRAKFGNSWASIFPSAPASVACGSSSSTTWTIGTVERDGPATVPPAAGSSRPRTGETTRNRSSTISGAGESTVANERTPEARAYSAAAPAPTSSASGMARADPPRTSPAGGSTNPPTISATRASMAAHPSSGRIFPAPQTTPAPISGGSRA